jgi:hypothetical protein
MILRVEKGKKKDGLKKDEAARGGKKRKDRGGKKRKDRFTLHQKRANKPQISLSVCKKAAKPFVLNKGKVSWHKAQGKGTIKYYAPTR